MPFETNMLSCRRNIHLSPTETEPNTWPEPLTGKCDHEYYYVHGLKSTKPHASIGENHLKMLVSPRQQLLILQTKQKKNKTKEKKLHLHHVRASINWFQYY